MSKPVFTTDAKTNAILGASLDALGFKNSCTFIAAEQGEDSITLNGKAYSKPVRLGVLIDALRSLSKESTSEEIILRNGTLNMDHGLFTPNTPDITSARLTEKEIAIIQLLHDKKGTIISRKELLTAVWGYAESVETHTLETHIYRLRQKIERDPASPENLVTTESGYQLL